MINKGDRSPVKWIVEVRENVEKKCRIEIWKTVSESVKNGKDEVKAVTDVDGDEDVVEAVFHLSSVS